MNKKYFLILFLIFAACKKLETETSDQSQEKAGIVTPQFPFEWGNANVYFLLTDRFYNGEKANDFQYDRKRDGAVLRNFMGGDLKGVTKKIESGYFDTLGITAIWFTPPVEQIHSFTDEGTGKTYGYHGYWARDWTAIDPNFGTVEELKELIETAHQHGIRILMDAVMNHTGPVTPIDTQWSNEWVRTDPTCTFQDIESTVECTLVDNLPDIYTAKNEEVALPDFLVEKWKAEGRYNQEIQELDAFFERTGYPKAPRYYLIKWLTDWVREMGIDGFRVDTAKHTHAFIWAELKKEALSALKEWKSANPDKKLDDLEFFMTGEVYNYSLHDGQNFNMGNNETVNFYKNGFESLINFSLKKDAYNSYESIFSSFDQVLNGELKGKSVLNYLTSHDDGEPFDLERKKVFEAGTKLLLCPGSSQVYYGDETARPLIVEGAVGDANLRSFMNWEALAANEKTNGFAINNVYNHWAKLGRFRRAHLAVGMGKHTMLQEELYVFKREYVYNGVTDKVLVALDLDFTSDFMQMDVFGVFEDGDKVKDYYSDKMYTVKEGKIVLQHQGGIVLLGKE
ncbi:alpha-amylase family glycosyl hydrolase [Chondrinema litorale]|uniref:alpha-amylase family glycosyl hydrolase n=1 Tax=Chondrinema litorale TaxID=2994555 RepID=UPI002543E935|nr:alpha-amylase family glycosyl hydrolase [Chondrinema litorale]UZR93030.1 alpha-amylase family glycosyl hydrolase [Chondrinema litorale]